MALPAMVRYLPGSKTQVEKDNLEGYHCILALQGIGSLCITTMNYILSFH